MRLVSFRSQHDSSWRAGALVDDRVVDGHRLGWPTSMRDVLTQGIDLASARSSATDAVASGLSVGIAEVIVGPPVPDPGKILCVGLNYAAHAAESGMDRPDFPEIFAKFANTVVGPFADVSVPSAAATSVDYEGELAVVIGRAASRLTVEDALDHVVGYAVFNDLSARDLQMRTSQWTMGKSVDGFGPFGPAITLREDIADIQNLQLTTRVNGEIVQQASTASMLFTVVELLVEITSVITLLPGDVVATGTPEGVGMARDPQLFLSDGDVVEVSIDELGSIRNTIRAEVES